MSLISGWVFAVSPTHETSLLIHGLSSYAEAALDARIF